MYELVIIWDDGEKSIYTYDDNIEAEHAADNMKIALGHQIAWCCVREKLD